MKKQSIMKIMMSGLWAMASMALAATNSYNYGGQGFGYGHGVIKPPANMTFTNAGIRDVTVSAGQLSGVDPQTGAALSVTNLLSLQARSLAVVGGAISGNGSGMTNLNASALSSGAISADRLPSSGTWNAGSLVVQSGDIWGMKWKFAGDSDTMEMNQANTAWQANINGGGVSRFRWNTGKVTGGFTGPMVDFNVNGNSIFYGKVGIGTTSPDRSLTVNGVLRLVGTNYIESDNVWGMKWKFAGDADTVEMNQANTAWQHNINFPGVTKFLWFAPSNALQPTAIGKLVEFNVGGSNVFYGRVFVGTNNLATNLQVAGTVKATAFVGSGVGLTINPAQGDIPMLQ